MSALIGCVLVALLVGYFTGPWGFIIVLILLLLASYGWTAAIVIAFIGVVAAIYMRLKEGGYNQDTLLYRLGISRKVPDRSRYVSDADINHIVAALPEHLDFDEAGRLFDRSNAESAKAAQRKSDRLVNAAAFATGMALEMKAGKAKARRNEAKRLADNIALHVEQARRSTTATDRDIHIAEAERLKAKLMALNVH